MCLLFCSKIKLILTSCWMGRGRSCINVIIYFAIYLYFGSHGNPYLMTHSVRFIYGYMVKDYSESETG